MGVNIDSDTALVNFFPLVGANGFTAGDPQAGVPATQFTADWPNAVMSEINALIYYGSGTVYFDDANWTQTANAVELFAAERRPRVAAPSIFSMRTHDADGADLFRNWQRYQRTDYIEAAAQNTTQSLCGMSVGIYAPPNNSQYWVTFHGAVIQTDSTTTYSKIVLRASCRTVSGTCTVQATTTVDSDSSGIAVTWSVVNSLGGPILRAVLPVAVGKTFNIAAYGEINILVDR